MRPIFRCAGVQKLINVYKLWHTFLPDISKIARLSLGVKIDNLFLETTECVFKATYLTGQEKMICIKKASLKLDLLKFFLQLCWEIQSISPQRYILLSEKLNEIGKMMGGWIRQLEKTPPPKK